MALKVFVPYINPGMVKRFFLDNPQLNGVDVNLIDNRQDNFGLPRIYNSIIRAHIHEDHWLCFLHEDFEIKGEIFATDGLPHMAVYGSFGIRMPALVPISYGRHICSNKDGTNGMPVGKTIKRRTAVDTLDCQCVMVHTALLRAFPALCFDEALTFDLYVEDFCLSAQFRFGIPCMVLPLNFQHYSPGHITERYWRALDHVNAKFPDVGVAGPCSFIGGASAKLRAKFTYNIPAQVGRI